MEEYDLVKELHRFSYPLLVVHGTGDTKISIKEAKSFVDGYKGKKKLKIFEGGDHGIQDVPREMREGFLEDIEKWLAETLG